MTKRDLIKALRGLPDNAEIVIHDSDTGWFLKATRIAIEKRARIKKVVLESLAYNHIIHNDSLLSKAKTVYDEDAVED